MAEMATSAFIFFAHDKASNRNKNKNFDRDLKLLCELAYFCVQPMLLVITGSFLCVSVVLQVLQFRTFTSMALFLQVVVTYRLVPSRWLAI
jgi:hypothetical protein